MSEFKFVKSLWDNEYASKLSEQELLIYRSNILGSDQNITNTGGGNTSAKIMEKDPLTGAEVEVLWVKGSGGDLRTSKKENFSTLYNQKILELRKNYLARADKGYKTPAEDSMVDMYSHCTFNLNPRATSIDTPLHSFIKKNHVDHMHATAVIAVAASVDQVALTKKIWGDEMDYVPWLRPGLELALKLQETFEKNKNVKGILMGQHGFISWDNTSKDCYFTTLKLIDKAAAYIAQHDQKENTFGGQKYATISAEKQKEVLAKFLPIARGEISKNQKFISTVQQDDLVSCFVNSFDAARLAEMGTSCPDHFLRTKIKPLFLDWNPQSESIESLLAKFKTGIKKYREDYAAYYEKNKEKNSPAMRDPNPTVMLIPGIGIIGWGKNKSESRVTTEFYRTAVEVMKGAEAISKYVGMAPKEAFDIEYWALEEAKLKRMPKDKEFSRTVVTVIGAGSGIGKETAFKFASEGAHVVCVDVNEESAKGTAAELTKIYGAGIGVAGSGISGCGVAIGLKTDITNRASIREMYQQIIMAYGGIDHVVVTAGIFVPPDTLGNIPDDKWDLTFQINVKGLFLVADEAKAIFKEQGLRGSIVLTTSVNAAVSKKGSLAYDTSKAAANHLVRELAIELSPLVRVNGLAPATVVKGSTMFPRDRVIASLAKYNIDYSEKEDTEVLRNKLAEFYASRTLLKSAITPQDQAEGAFLLCSQALSKTTGQIISVDGGLHEAFLR